MESELVSGIVNPTAALVTPETHSHSFINALVVSFVNLWGMLSVNLFLKIITILYFEICMS